MYFSARPIAILLAGAIAAQAFSVQPLVMLRLLTEPALSGHSFSPNEVFGGDKTTGFISLSAPAGAGGKTVTLSTTSSVLIFPSTVTVSEGSTSATYVLSVGTVTQVYTRSVVASADGASRTAIIVIRPGLKELKLIPSNVTGGSPTTGFIIFHGKPGLSEGVNVATSDSSSAISTPGIVHVQGSDESFTVTTSQVNADSVRFVFATLNGVTRSRALTLTVGPRLSTFSISPNPVKGGQDTVGTATLTGPPQSERSAQVTDNSSVVITPTEIPFVQGQTSNSFAIKTPVVGSNTNRLVTVSLGGVSRTAVLTLTP